MTFHLKMTGLALATSVGLALGAGAARAEKWDLPAAYPDGNYHTQTLKLFAEGVKKATGGKIDIVVHANGSLFKGNDIKRAVQTGQAPIGERLLSAHANESPMFGLDNVPFLATSFDESDKLWAAMRPEIEKVLDRQNLVLLYSVQWPPQGFYFKKQVDSVADMKGIKFRSYNTATARIAALAGMQPVQIEAAELPQALSTGVVESFISSGSTGYDSKAWENISHFVDVQAWLPRNYVIVNKDVWNKLDAPTRDAVKAEAAKAEKAGNAKARELTGWYLEQLKAKGMKVSAPTDKLKADLQAIGKTMTEEWLKAAGDAGKAVMTAFQK
jgi:TRAP-type C4-dicarboxylate transport system substrate-binding protein